MVNLDTVKQFFFEARQELKKVTWPTKQQTITATWVVIAVTAALAIFLGFADWVFAKVIGYILT